MSMQEQMARLAAAERTAADSAARRQLARLFDDGVFTEIDRFVGGDAPPEAVAGFGTVDGTPVYAFAQAHDVCRGAVTPAQADKMKRMYELAAQNGAPIVGIFDSDGAKLDDGLGAMDGIAAVLRASADISGVVPQIAVVAGSCVGSAAMIAAAADVVIAAKDADYYLTPGENAHADVTADSAEDAVAAARTLLGYFPANNLEAAPLFEADDAAAPLTGEVGSAAKETADAGSWFPFGEYTALARIAGGVCGMVTLQGDAIACRAAGEIARFVRLCDSFSLPIVTFVDAAGFACLKGAAKVSQAYIGATSPKISVIGGRAIGAVYIAAAGKAVGADAVLAWPQAVIAPLAPATAVQIEWADRLKGLADPIADREALEREYAATRCSPLSAAAGGFVTDVVAPADTKARLVAYLEMLGSKRVSKLPRKHANIQL